MGSVSHFGGSQEGSYLPLSLLDMPTRTLLSVLFGTQETRQLLVRDFPEIEVLLMIQILHSPQDLKTMVIMVYSLLCHSGYYNDKVLGLQHSAYLYTRSRSSQASEQPTLLPMLLSETALGVSENRGP